MLPVTRESSAYYPTIHAAIYRGAYTYRTPYRLWFLYICCTAFKPGEINQWTPFLIVFWSWESLAVESHILASSWRRL
ncbi:hypothetical protein ACT3OH_16815 [Vreelandella zhanjiangensis]|uniref:hypothetical protein n=1 Tax=Vreelandella zhanjiangensis TaxID=1121960 RepID=UPI00402A90DD